MLQDVTEDRYENVLTPRTCVSLAQPAQSAILGINLLWIIENNHKILKINRPLKYEVSLN